MWAGLQGRAFLLAGLVLAAALGLGAQAVPYIYQPPVPSATPPGGPGFTLAIRGAGFVAGAVVDWDGQALPTTFVSSAEVTAAVPASAIGTAHTATITVHNPGVPVASNLLYFQVHSPIPSLNYTNAPNSPVALGGQGISPNFPYSIVAGDFEGKGQTDLLMGINTGRVIPGYVDFFAGNGDGTFTAPVSSTGVGEAPGSIALGDFTGNGRLDAAVANAYTVGGQPTVTVLLNNGDGTFSPAPGGPLDVGTLPLTIVTADFNHDGRLDLAVACQSAIYVFLGNGDGTFAAAPGSPFAEKGGGGTGLTVGDFNGDGNLDLAVARGGPEINLFLGNGDGSFTPAPGDPIIAQAWFAGGSVAIAAGDFNGDGQLDLFASQTGNQGIDVLLGNGDGTFTQPATPVAGCCADQIFNGIYGWNLVLGDFLANGKLDAAVMEEQVIPGISDYIYTYLGNGDGTFTPSDYSMLLPESQTTMITVGDFNGDGLLDFATASQPYNYYNVLLSQPTPGPAPDLSLSVPFPPASTSIQQGHNATWVLGVTSLNGFTGPVLLTCAAGLPANTTCAFTPADAPAAAGITPAVGGGVVPPDFAAGYPPGMLSTLKIQTAAPTLVTPGAAPPGTGGGLPGGRRWLPLGLLLAAGAVFLSRQLGDAPSAGGCPAPTVEAQPQALPTGAPSRVGRLSRLAAGRRRRAVGWAALCLALLASLGASSCASAPPKAPPPPYWTGGTPPGDYTITIQAVAYPGSPLTFTRTMPLAFTVTAVPGEAATAVRAGR